MNTIEKCELLDRCLQSNVRMDNEDCKDCLINERKNPISDYKGEDKRISTPSCDCGICQDQEAEIREHEAKTNHVF